MNQLWLALWPLILSTLIWVQESEGRSPDPWRRGAPLPVWFGEPSPEVSHSRQKRSYGATCPRKCDPPVCALNGLTYCNKCHAQCLGIYTSEGACKDWIPLSEDCCAGCERTYRPVCACGRVYYNPCVAECMHIPQDMVTDGVCS